LLEIKDYIKNTKHETNLVFGDLVEILGIVVFLLSCSKYSEFLFDTLFLLFVRIEINSNKDLYY